MMVAEMKHYDSDIFVLQVRSAYRVSIRLISFQEVDRLGAFLPLLPAYQAIETRGPGKQHGLVILYRSSKYRVIAQRTIYLDDELLRDAYAGGVGSEDLRKRRAGTRQTKNVGLIVALEEVDGGAGLIVATTHLLVLVALLSS
jgi:RNA exonuclease NGL2